MRDTFGIERVLQPRGAVPVTAWKVDNSKKFCLMKPELR